MRLGVATGVGSIKLESSSSFFSVLLSSEGRAVLWPWGVCTITILPRNGLPRLTKVLGRELQIEA